MKNWKKIKKTDNKSTYTGVVSIIIVIFKDKCFQVLIPKM